MHTYALTSTHTHSHAHTHKHIHTHDSLLFVSPDAIDVHICSQRRAPDKSLEDGDTAVGRGQGHVQDLVEATCSKGT